MLVGKDDDAVRHLKYLIKINTLNDVFDVTHVEFLRGSKLLSEPEYSRCSETSKRSEIGSPIFRAGEAGISSPDSPVVYDWGTEN